MRFPNTVGVAEDARSAASRLRTRALVRITASLLVAGAYVGCSPDGAGTAPDDPDLSVVAGDQQTGFSSAPLDAPLSIVMHSRSGRPRSGVIIRWTAEGGGRISPDSNITDDSGRATAIWMLGPGDGAQAAHALSDRYNKEVDFHATAQHSASGATIVVMHLATPDGSGQTVHPDFVAMPAPWKPATNYLLATPYPNGDASFENPSLFSGPGDFIWSRPPGVHNPIATPGNGAYLSDPDALYDPDVNQLWVYYREVRDSNYIELVHTADGVHFSDPQTVVSARNHDIVSPTVVRRSATDWIMWSVNANYGCSAETTFVEARHSVDGTHWSDPAPVKLKQPGYSVWHIDVQWIPSRNEYWAVYNVKTPGNCTTPAAFMATSPDGVNWTTYPQPLLQRGAIPEFSDIVYRSTFSYDAVGDSISFWYSGARYDGNRWDWRSAYQRRDRSNVFAGITRPPSGAVASRYLSPRPGVPRLLDAP